MRNPGATIASARRRIEDREQERRIALLMGRAVEDAYTPPSLPFFDEVRPGHFVLSDAGKRLVTETYGLVDAPAGVVTEIAVGADAIRGIGRLRPTAHDCVACGREHDECCGLCPEYRRQASEAESRL